LIAAIALAASCGSAPAPAACRLAARPADPGAAPLLWRVRAAGGATVWLFGTIHDVGADDVPPAAWRSLDAAARLVSELGDDEPDRARLAQLARLPWGQVLDHMLSADDWWNLVIALAGAMSQDELRHARPWFALVRLRAHITHAVQPSMDAALAATARRRGLAVEPLESWEQQLVALDASVTAADLSTAIRGRSTAACDLAALVSAYRARDLPLLTRMLVIADRAELVVERNQRWMPQLERHLAEPGPGSTFVAVGLGHLLGDHGLPAMLARAGYTVERATAELR
jgi:uncharacterized protein YbaP (TraB family)